MKRARRTWLCVYLLLWLAPATAHQLGTAIFVLQPEGELAQATHWEVRAELPLGGRRQAPVIGLDPGLPCEIQRLDSVRVDELIVRRWRFDCATPWLGQRLQILGLDPQTPDALIQVRSAEPGAEETAQFYSVDRSRPDFVLTTDPAPPAVAQYFRLGLEHIAGGLDHLLFVVLLFWCCQGLRLLFALTGFTLAHAVSLSAVLMGGVQVPAAPVEALIALSLTLLAAEQLRHLRGQVPGWTLRHPGGMAFGFGLLHGLGFAGALAALGLPAEAEWRALLLFNLGIEAGQLLLVALLAALLWCWRRGLPQLALARAQPLALYGIGIVGVTWACQRMWLSV